MIGTPDMALESLNSALGREGLAKANPVVRYSKANEKIRPP